MDVDMEGDPPVPVAPQRRRRLPKLPRFIQPPDGWLEGINRKLGFVGAKKLLIAAKREAIA